MAFAKPTQSKLSKCRRESMSGGSQFLCFLKLRCCRCAFGLFLVMVAYSTYGSSRGAVIIGPEGRGLNIGSFHLLAIGIDDYKNQNLKLRTASRGARDLRATLLHDYTFDSEFSELLLDSEATRESIIASLRRLAKEAGPEDSILIYYAGHGHIDELTGSGSWIPWDATFETPALWIRNDDIRDLVKAMKARHVLLISDSCFAGDLFRSQPATTSQIMDPGFRRAFSRNSRQVMTAGGLEPVTDGGQGGHSIYTWWLLKTLKDAASTYLLPEQIHDRVKKAVSLDTRQRPILGLLHGVGGEPDGSFVFFRRGIINVDAALEERRRRKQELQAIAQEVATPEIREKHLQLEALDREIRELEVRLEIDHSQSDLELMLERLKKRESRAKELAALRLEAEEGIEARESSLAEARRQEDEERSRRFEVDYAYYKQIAASNFASEDLKIQAWNTLVQSWRISRDVPPGSVLKYQAGEVVIDFIESALVQEVSFDQLVEVAIHVSFPHANEIMGVIRAFGTPETKVVSFGNESERPDRWVVAVGASLDIELVQAVLGACLKHTNEIWSVTIKTDAFLGSNSSIFIGTFTTKRLPRMKPARQLEILRPGVTTSDLQKLLPNGD